MAHVFPYPSTVKANAFLSELGYIFEEILGGLVLYQPDRPSAFIKAYASGKMYEGEMRGESVFNKESATMYMKILAGPIIAELLQRVLELDEDDRPRNKGTLNAWIIQNIDAIGAKIDQASVRIASSVKGIAARKRVSRMKADPSIRDRANAAIASGSYGAGASSKAKAKAAKQAATYDSQHAHTGAVLATDTNTSTVGRGEEKQVMVDEGAFEEYIRKQAELQREAEEAKRAQEEAAAAQAAAEAEQNASVTNETGEPTANDITEATVTSTEAPVSVPTVTDAVTTEPPIPSEPTETTAPIATTITTEDTSSSSSTESNTETVPVPVTTDPVPTTTENTTESTAIATETPAS